MHVVYFFVFFKQKTAYEMRISDWSSDVCSSDLRPQQRIEIDRAGGEAGSERRRATEIGGHPAIQRQRTEGDLQGLGLRLGLAGAELRREREGARQQASARAGAL